MRLYKALAGNPLEVLCAVLMIALGVYVSAIGASEGQQDSSGLIAAGTIMTTIGGVLISWIASRAYAHEQAHAEFSNQLGTLSRNLGQAAGQIGRSVDQALANEVDAVAGFAMVAQANQMVYGQVNEIAVIQGAGFDPAYLIETAQSLEDLATQLASRERNVDDEGLESVRRELERVTSALSGSSVRRSYPLVTVHCPYCKARNEARLGNLPGDTASGTCTTCQQPFFAHRSRSGTTFTRKPGLPRARATPDISARWTFNCPECDFELSTAVTASPKLMVCTACDTAIFVDPVNRSSRSDGKFTRSHTTVTERSGSRPQLTCPVCGLLRNALLTVGTNYLALCLADRQVMEVSIEEWNEWRSEHDQGGEPSIDGTGS